jgi:hypothetical protein
MTNKAPKSRDYFGEMYAAGVLADHGWNVYFPRRDKGFDFIITKPVRNQIAVRPVQVKGLYPTEQKKPRSAYGYIGKLSQIHPDTVLALVFFDRGAVGAAQPAPKHVALMPWTAIRTQQSRGYACRPAQLTAEGPKPGKDFVKYFDLSGIELLEANSSELSHLCRHLPATPDRIPANKG